MIRFDKLTPAFSEYDFFTFNNNAGNITVTTYVSPSLNAFGPDRPIGFAVQVDSQAPQTNYFIPPAPAGSLPDAWNQFVSDSIVLTSNSFTADPGAHTVKIWMVEPTVVVQKIVIGESFKRVAIICNKDS